MPDDILKIIRYNTGNDKKAFVNFKDDFDAVIFNSTIVAHSGGAVADLVSMYKNQYIIDPQTHIVQHETAALQSFSTGEIKSSILKYLTQLPPEILKNIRENKKPLTPKDIMPYIPDLVQDVYSFETEFVNSFIKEKEYEKYLKYAGVGPQPKLLIAPYFMLKNSYSREENTDWLSINKQCIKEFIQANKVKKYPIAAQIVIDKQTLIKPQTINEIVNTYNFDGFVHVFLWIDDFSSFAAKPEERESFKKLIELFAKIGKRIIMAYGGYDSILLCNAELPFHLYGVAQSIGYGESRPITPVGGGFPVNKYYFPPIHKRLNLNEALDILSKNGFFSAETSTHAQALKYHKLICNCKQCRQIISGNINNFIIYNESTPFIIKKRAGNITRNHPTTDASLISATHFLYCKVEEWNNVLKHPIDKLFSDLQKNFLKYAPSEYYSIKNWCEIYAK